MQLQVSYSRLNLHLRLQIMKERIWNSTHLIMVDPQRIIMEVEEDKMCDKLAHVFIVNCIKDLGMLLSIATKNWTKIFKCRLTIA